MRGAAEAYFLVADDMMDASITRRGHPCWYRVEGVANIAINDAFMLEAAIYHLLKIHFKGKPYYGHLLELFHDVTFQTELGQLIDLNTAPEDSVDLSKFSLDKHTSLSCTRRPSTPSIFPWPWRCACARWMTRSCTNRRRTF